MHIRLAGPGLATMLLAGCGAGTDVAIPPPNPALDLPSIDTFAVRRVPIPDSLGGASADMGRAVFLGDGQIAIGDWDGKRVLLFDSTGSPIRVIGREGAGPGEFRAPVLVQAIRRDSLLIWDPYLRRVSRLSVRDGTGGDFVLPSEAASGSAPVVGILEDGRLVLRHESIANDPTSPQVVTEIRVLSWGAARWRTIARLAPVARGDAGGYRFFQRRIQVAVAGNRILVGHADAWRIDVLDPGGRLVDSLQRPWHARAVTLEDKARARAAIDRPALAPGFLDDDRFDAEWPPFATILAGPRNTSWVLDYAPPYASPDSVSVFNGGSGLLGVLALPAAFKPTDVTDRAILGVARTADGDFEVVQYSLRW